MTTPSTHASRGDTELVEVSESRPLTRTIAFVLLIAFIVYAAVLILSALTRKPWNDEAMAASAAYTLATRGYLGTPVFDDFQFFHIQKVTYFIFPLWMCLLAVWFKIAGASLFAMRALSMICSLGLLYAIYRLMKHWTGNRIVAISAVILTAFDFQMMTAASFGRYDVIVAALGFGAYALYLELRNRNLRLALLLAGSCLMAAAATHPNALVYILGLALLIAWLDLRRLRFLEFGSLIAPFIIGVALWGAYIAQDPVAFRAQMNTNTGHRIGLFRPIESATREFQERYLRSFGLGEHSANHSTPAAKLKVIPLILYIAGIAGCLLVPAIRRRPGYRTLFVLTAWHVCFFTFYENMKFSYYLVHILPLYIGLLVIFGEWLWNTRPRLRPAMVVGVLGLLILEVGGILLKVRINDYQNSYTPAVAFLQKHAAPSDLVFASCSLWFAYGPDRNLIDDDTLGYTSHKEPRFVVYEEIYDDLRNLQRSNYPDVARHIDQLLASSRLVYDNAGYRIYQVF